jgi:hypothetical protein
MVEAGTWSLPGKVHPEKKPQSKNTRRYLIGNLIPYQTPSSFLTSGFFFRCTFAGKLLLEKSAKATVHMLVLNLVTTVYVSGYYRGGQPVLPETEFPNLGTEAHGSGLDLKFGCYIFYIGNPHT